EITKMGSTLSTLREKGYNIEKEQTENGIVATKGDEKFLIKKIILPQVSSYDTLIAEIQSLRTTNHPHIVSSKNSFEDGDTYYVVMDYCQGGNLAEKIKGMTHPPEEFEALSVIVEICLALTTIHEKGLLHKHLTPEFSAQTTLQLIPKIIGGRYPDLPEHFSPGLRQLLSDILHKEPQSRPTASEILKRPFIIKCLSEKCKTTVKKLQEKLSKLRQVADGLERVHQGTTIGSLAGGVIGAVGGVTSIVGLILAPFTLGASLIVTGVGVGVGAVGGVTAGASNITNMVNQSSDRKAIRNIITEIKDKINAVVNWLQEISKGLQRIRSLGDLPNTPDTGDSQFNNDNLTRLSSRAGKGIGGIVELVRLLQVLSIGKIAAQASRAVCVAEVATGVLSGLFVAVDIFFIAMDAKEIHHIRQARAEREQGTLSETENTETENTSDQAKLFDSSLMNEVSFDNAEEHSKKSAPIRSEVMKFVQSIREAASNLQEVLDELKNIISSIPSLEREQEWHDMELL
ncbi:hypothetical protein L3Q82_020594, partial [Scortum barcoo]